jgi:hypothetical protein
VKTCGELDPEDPSANLVVQLGAVRGEQELDPPWYEHNKRPRGRPEATLSPRMRATRDNHGVVYQAGGQASVAEVCQMKFGGSPCTILSVENTLGVRI